MFGKIVWIAFSLLYLGSLLPFAVTPAHSPANQPTFPSAARRRCLTPGIPSAQDFFMTESNTSGRGSGAMVVRKTPSTALICSYRYPPKKRVARKFIDSGDGGRRRVRSGTRSPKVSPKFDGNDIILIWKEYSMIMLKIDTCGAATHKRLLLFHTQNMGILLKSTRIICAKFNSTSKFSSNPLQYPRETYTPRRLMSYLTGHNQSQKLLMAREHEDSIYYHRFSTDDGLSWKHSDLHVKSRHKYFLPYASCNSLILATTDPGCQIPALWNPTTGQIKSLPKSIFYLPAGSSNINLRHMVYGLGFDPAAQDYKVIGFFFWTFLQDDDICCDRRIELYSLKTNSWKAIDASVTEPIPYFTLHINGVFYWRADDMIMTFNFATEEFGHFPMPPTDLFLLCNCCFAELDGSFAVVVYDRTAHLINRPHPRKFEIWKWDDDDVSWARVPVETDAVPAAADAEQLVALVNGNMVFVRDSKGEILTFDIATRELKHLHLYSNKYEVFILPYVESSFRIKHNKVKKGRQRQGQWTKEGNAFRVLEFLTITRQTRVNGG
ncbi:F-box family protein [Striga asiatica]|uniref:F-box family protein n=1 Tax=Striga asiatica TaxID=4170 RepID=A0A5A7RGP5_STRAF|nr:F-box family protein [Striga asiatica]